MRSWRWNLIWKGHCGSRNAGYGLRNGGGCCTLTKFYICLYGLWNTLTDEGCGNGMIIHHRIME